MQVLFIRRQQAAKLIGVSPATLTRWHQRGILRMTRITGRVMGYESHVIADFISKRGEKK